MCYWDASDCNVLFFSLQLRFIVALRYNSITAAWTAVRRSISTVFVESDLRWKSFHQTMAESVWRPLRAPLFMADSLLSSSPTSSKSVSQEKWAIAKSCKMSDPPDLSRPAYLSETHYPPPSPPLPQQWNLGTASFTLPLKMTFFSHSGPGFFVGSGSDDQWKWWRFLQAVAEGRACVRATIPAYQELPSAENIHRLMKPAKAHERVFTSPMFVSSQHE